MFRSRLTSSSTLVVVGGTTSNSCRRYFSTSSSSRNGSSRNDERCDDLACSSDASAPSKSVSPSRQQNQYHQQTEVDHYARDQNHQLSQSAGLMDPNAAFVSRFGRQGVANGRLTPQAQQYYERLYHNLGDKANPLVEKMKELIGDQDPKNMTQHQRNLYSTLLAQEANSVFGKHTKEMFNEHKGMKEFAETGAPTGENYWFEAAGSLTSHELPREMKDDLFEEMKRNRPEGSRATKDTGF